ncbi:MAG TPA: glycoside hydrolase family 2 TIM barrel-domain containing protein [Tepidisphaeraceae bacterium]|jgi:beta-galactosidase|nr:glycoside hydrolase family 2 TIM barrel-domain containing protein [Tepidisphaeraceae bacterium]
MSRQAVLLGWLCAVLFSGTVFAAGGRAVKPLDFDWRFHLGDLATGANADLDDSAWQGVDVPHDWSIEVGYKEEYPAATGHLAGGIGWYRRVVDVPADWAGKQVSVEFDAVATSSTVYWNGQQVGGRHYGYVSFACDLTGKIKPGKNLLAIRIDDANWPDARWYMGAGIHGHVRLLKTETTHIAQYGVNVTTPTISPDRAIVKVETQVENAPKENAEVRWEILDAAGKIAASGKSDVSATGMASTEMNVDHPSLWSTDSPAMYSVVTRIYQQGEMLDEVRTPFGIRQLKWDADTGFWLNGQNVKLKGMCMHYDAGGALGVAVPDVVNEWRLRKLKAMGCNAVRTAHTPFPPVFYDICDRIGLMVIDESFDGWKKKAPFDYGALYFAKEWKQDLGDVVHRDRNHPSIIAWSVGNETGERDIHGMRDFVHSIEPTRIVTGGQLLEGVDVAGFTGRGETTGVLQKFRDEHPGLPILLTEETHAYSTRGFYRVVSAWQDPDNQAKRVPYTPYGTTEIFTGGDPQWVSSYDNNVVRLTCRQCTKRTMETPWICGEFRWSGFEYLGEAGTRGRHWPMRYATEAAIDSAGFEEDIFYFYQSQYTSAPMVHLLPHWTWNDDMRGTTIPVVAYSNCQEVELFQDGKSLGRKKESDLLEFLWQVKYSPGELKAIGYRDGNPVAEEKILSAGDPAKIKMSAEGSIENRGDMAMVKIEAQDDRGNIVPTAADRVAFAVIGSAGKWTGAENGNPTDVTCGKTPQHDLFMGLERAYIRGTGDKGDTELVGLALLAGKKQMAIDCESIVLQGNSGGSIEVRYTTDGTDPTEKSEKYANPVELKSGEIIKAAALRDGKVIVTVDGRRQ